MNVAVHVRISLILSLLAGCGAAPVSPETPAPTASAPVETSPPQASLPALPPVSVAPVATPPPRPVTIALARTPRGPADDLLDAGDKAFERDDYLAARKAYEAAKKADAKHPGGETGLARTTVAALDLPTDYAVAKGNAKLLAAVTTLEAVRKKFSDYGPVWVEEGRAKLLLGDAEGALSGLREGYRLLPNEPEAASALGVALLATGDVRGAEKYLVRAKELDPGSAARHGNLGTVYFLLGRVAEAIVEYDAAAHITPNDPKKHADLGTALLASGDFKRAETELGAAIALDPKRATFKSNLGYAYQSEGKLPEAKAQYEAALALDPKLASAWINLATLLAKTPATRGEARKALLKAQAIDATDPRVKANLEELDALEQGRKP